MTKEEAKEILEYMRMAFLPEEYIEVAQPCGISDEQVNEALTMAIDSLGAHESDMTFDPLEKSVL